MATILKTCRARLADRLVAHASTFPPTIEKNIRRFPIKRMIAVTDRGLLSTDNLAELQVLEFSQEEFVAGAYGSAYRFCIRCSLRRHSAADQAPADSRPAIDSMLISHLNCRSALWTFPQRVGTTLFAV